MPPPRSLLSVDLGRRGSYVCKACLDSLRLTNLRPWVARQPSRLSSSTARKPQPPQQAPSKKTEDVPDQAQLRRIFLEELERGPEPPSATTALDVAYFNKEPSGKFRRLKDNDEFAVESGGLDTEIESAISHLEQQMVDTAKMLQKMEKQGNKEKADELRRQFKKTLRLQYKGKMGPEGEKYGVLRITGFSGLRRRPVEALNAFLARDSVVEGGIPRPRDVVECWKYYSAARKTLAMAWDNVPREVWDFLWMILSWEGDGIEDPNRMQHIYMLAKDMQSAGVPLRDPQQLLAIEAMFIEGWREEAIDAWKKAAGTLGSKRETFTDYYELGVRMLCLHGDTNRAQRAAETLLRSSHPPNARILLPLIRAQAEKEATVADAWESYTNMRMLLGETITIEDYDEVINIFLTFNCVEYALQAFIDMMFSKAIDIRGKTRLPLAVGNHFFIGKWLKRLIGAGDLDGAYKVVVYVQSKGITPSPIQLNGLLGAWLRSGTAENQEKAETLAWAMIQARLDYVALRRRHKDVLGFWDPCDTSPVDENSGEGTQDAQYGPVYRCRTRATAETFSILAENYCTRGLHDRLKELFEVLKQAEVGPTSFLMNQIVRSYSQNGQADEAIRLYRTMTTEQGVRPDGHTFLTLFNSLSVNRLVLRDPELSRQDMLTARAFFRDMVEADWTFDTADIFAQLPRTILFSMLKTKDYHGMMVAARAMRELFGFHPTEALLVEMASGSSTSLLVRTKRNAERLLAGRRTIEGLMRKHRMDLLRKGHPGDDMTAEERVAELHDVLEKWILLKGGAPGATEEQLQPHLEEAAREMGVYDIVVRKDAMEIARRRKLNKAPALEPQ
ncbi:hypothetical protein VTJ49DRAFT_3228 [Mycothermus thermophilus]|uniref:Pentatricopeptide repeat protein n=1 Tax=Humicola insolens TaxID=85995 RepID=A0ABR3V855_HUMIN